MPELESVNRVDDKPDRPSFKFLHTHQPLSNATSNKSKGVGPCCRCSNMGKKGIKGKPCNEINTDHGKIYPPCKFARFCSFRAPSKPTPESSCDEYELKSGTCVIFLLKEQKCVEKAADVPPWPGNTWTIDSIPNSNN